MKYLKHLLFLMSIIAVYQATAQQNKEMIDSLLRVNDNQSVINIIEDDLKKDINKYQKINLLSQKTMALSNNKDIVEAKSTFSDLQNLLSPNYSLPSETEMRIMLAHVAILVDENKGNETKEILLKAIELHYHNDIDSWLSTQVFARIANQYRLEKNIDSTLLYVNEGLSLLDRLKSPNERYESQIRLLYQKAAIYRSLSQNEKSLDVFFKLANLAEQEKDSTRLSNFNNSIAVRYFSAGDYGQTKYYLEKAMAINIKKYGPKSNKFLSGMQNLALTYTKLQNYENAEFYYQKYYNSIKELKGEEAFEMGRLNFNLGMVHLQKKEFEKAISRFESSLKIRKKFLDPNHSDIAHCHQVIGSSYIQQNRHKESLPHFTRALAIREKIGNAQDPELIRIYSNLALIYEKQNDLEKAKSNLEKAYINTGYIKENNFDFNKVANPFLMTDLLGANIKILNNKYQSLPTLDNFNSALAITQKVDTLIDFMKNYLDDPASRRIFRQKQKSVYDQSINFFSTRYNNDQDPNALANIFRLIEEGNNGMIYEKIASENSPSQLGMPNEIIEQKQSMEDSLVFYENMLTESKEEDSDLFDKVALFKEQYYNLLSSIETIYPKYFKSIYEFPIISLRDYQNSLVQKETSLTFYIGDYSTIAIMVKPDQTRLFNLGSSQIVAEQITEYSAALRDKNNPERFTKSSQQLHELLIAPLPLDDTEHLTIIADGIFGLIPFGLLKDSVTSSFLLERMSISNQYSATIKVINRGKQANKNKVLAMAPIFESAENENPLFAAVYDENDTYRSDMVALRESENELNSIKRLFSGNYFLRSEANEAKFKELAPNSSIIHMATHGYVNHDNPDKSKLYFFSDSTSAEDGQLNAYEIMNLDLSRTQLVTLSACNTGVGAIRDGEGVASLGRAFAYAGCQNQLISLWPANDKSTTQLMSSFYSNLKEGYGKATALKNAKLTYLSSAPEILKHPYYWAGFVYYGSDDKLLIRSKLNLPLFLGLLSFGLLFIGFLIRKRLGRT